MGICISRPSRRLSISMPMAMAAYAPMPEIGTRKIAEIEEKKSKIMANLRNARHRELYTPSSAQMSGPAIWGPQISTQVERSELKVSLEDNTGGKAKVEKKGSWGRGLNLVHTGAVP